MILAVLLLSCVADAYTTAALLKRGGKEVNAAWLVGEHPSPTVCWLAFGILPALIGTACLLKAPATWPAFAALAALKLYFSVRNHKLMR